MVRRQLQDFGDDNSLLSRTFQIVRRDYPMIRHSRVSLTKCQSPGTQNCVKNAIVNGNAAKKRENISDKIVLIWFTYQQEVIQTLYVENFKL